MHAPKTHPATQTLEHICLKMMKENLIGVGFCWKSSPMLVITYLGILQGSPSGWLLLGLTTLVIFLRLWNLVQNRMMENNRELERNTRNVDKRSREQGRVVLQTLMWPSKGGACFVVFNSQGAWFNLKEISAIAGMTTCLCYTSVLKWKRISDLPFSGSKMISDQTPAGLPDSYAQKRCPVNSEYGWVSDGL